MIGGVHSVSLSFVIDHERPDAVVAEQDVAETDDGQAHSTFTVAIVRPEGSRV